MNTLVVPVVRSADSAKAGPQTIGVAMTVVRIPIGLAVLDSVLFGDRLFGALGLILFVGLDILDGAIARTCDGDTAQRRGLDSIIDRSVVTLFFLEASSHMYAFLPAAASIVAVNLAGIPFVVTSWRRYRVVLKAPAWHHTWSLLLFIGGMLYFAHIWSAAIVISTLGAIFFVACSSILIDSHRGLAKAPEFSCSD